MLGAAVIPHYQVAQTPGVFVYVILVLGMREQCLQHLVTFVCR